VWKIIHDPEILPVIISAHRTENKKNGRKTKEEKGVLFLGCT
jgi:hypothetical protein